MRPSNIYKNFYIYVHIIYPNCQTDEQKIYKIDAHWSAEYSQKKNQASIVNVTLVNKPLSNLVAEKIVFPPKPEDGRILVVSLLKR